MAVSDRDIGDDLADINDHGISFRKTVLMSLLGLLAIPVAVLYDYVFWGRTLGLSEMSGIGLIAVSIYMLRRTK